MEGSSSSQGRTLVKMSNIVETEVYSVKKRIQTWIKGMKEFDTTNMKQFMDLLSLVEEEFILAKKRIQTRMMGMDKDESHGSAVKQLKLQFKHEISPTVFPGVEIKGGEGAPLEVALVDFSTGELVEVGPEASTTVEIVLLKMDPDASEGDEWTTKEFEKNIVWDMEGKVSSLIVGNTRVKLQGGIGKIENIKLRHRAKKMNTPAFHLGARVVDTVVRDRIKETKTQRFSVGNYRKKYFLKHASPVVTDEVSRLVNISKCGNIEKRLNQDGIFSVGDFLIRLLIDPEGLKSIVRAAPKKWNDTVSNAQACKHDKIYCYTNLLQGESVAFNILGEVLGMYLDAYTPTNYFSEYHKGKTKELLASARANWAAVKAFDKTESLIQYLIASKRENELKRLHLNSLSSFWPSLPSCGLTSNGPSERGESSRRRFPTSRTSETIEESNQRSLPSSGLVSPKTSDMVRESCRPSNLWVQSKSPALHSVERGLQMVLGRQFHEDINHRERMRWEGKKGRTRGYEEKSPNWHEHHASGREDDMVPGCAISVGEGRQYHNAWRGLGSYTTHQEQPHTITEQGDENCEEASLGMTALDMPAQPPQPEF